MTVLEFKLLTAVAGTFAGITRNFSYEGLCLETQCVTFEQGDNVELLLRHPHSDVPVCVPAYVVWKRTADKFAYLMGLKLLETELDSRLRMLEIMSAAGDIPVDSFLSDGSDDGIEHGDITASARETDHLAKYSPSQQPAETNDINIEPEEFGDQGLLNTERDLVTGKTSGNTFDEVLKTIQTDEQQAEDMSDEENLESDEPWPRHKSPEEENDQAPGVSTPLLKQLLEHRMFIYSSVTAVILGISVYALFLLFHRPDSIIKSQAPVPVQSAFPQQEEQSRITPPVQQTGSDEAAPPVIQEQEEQHISKSVSSRSFEQEVPDVRAKPDDNRTADDQSQYVQVGAWRNPDNAREMLQKIQKYYPDAYMTAGKKLNKVKIPVRNQTQAKSIIKDIEDKFHLKPLVTSER